ncbi:MAG: T9SS type A sorting domain-containing protein [Calditrichales bacterium]|nr:T9SS type A sorting domain-containing protein [Calditrichales bacterium]
MKNKLSKLLLSMFLMLLFTTPAYPLDRTAPLIIDHSCSTLPSIPMNWIDSVQANQRLHYAHTSHGGQLTTGLDRIENADPAYNAARGSKYLPTVADAFCIFDGQENDTYISPDEYWEEKKGMDYTRDVLNNNPTINASMWSWCCQVNDYSEEKVQAYLDSITALEGEFPNVTFIYITGNAQTTGSGGYNRYLRNEQIRQYCISNNKVLFDFADLDSWWYNPSTEGWEFASYEYESHTVPVEHEQFHGSEAGHTTYESCEQKGRAVWWMMSRLANWQGTTSASEDNLKKPEEFMLNQNYPNPFNPTTTIRYDLPEKSKVVLTVYDLIGSEICTLVNERQSAGLKSIEWDARNASGKTVNSGVYVYQLRVSDSSGKAGAKIQSKKMIFLK